MLAFLATFTFSALFAKHEEKSFLSWMRNTNQIFTGDEYHFRFGIFLTNSRRIQEFNSVKRTFKVGLNKFACYTPAEEDCAFDQSKAVNKILSFETGKAGDESYLKTLLTKGVCAIGIDASQWSFQTYSGGIYDESAKFSS